jgi:hypothetical protein
MSPQRSRNLERRKKPSRGIDALSKENRNFSIVYFFLAANLARLGRKDEPRTSIETGLLLNPGFTIRRFQAGMPSDHPAFVAGFQRTLEALREAGVPEG